MHRHGYRGRKFGRKRDERRALLKGLADSLVIHESVQTTLPKAKELTSYTEKLITKAKKGDLHSRRQVIGAMATEEAAHKLVDELAPKLKSRNSGYLRIERTVLRRGDGTQMARISFVDDLKVDSKPATKQQTERKPSVAKATAKKTTAETASKSPSASVRGKKESK